MNDLIYEYLTHNETLDNSKDVYSNNINKFEEILKIAKRTIYVLITLLLVNLILLLIYIL